MLSHGGQQHRAESRRLAAQNRPFGSNSASHSVYGVHSPTVGFRHTLFSEGVIFPSFDVCRADDEGLISGHEAMNPRVKRDSDELNKENVLAGLGTSGTGQCASVHCTSSLCSSGLGGKNEFSRARLSRRSESPVSTCRSSKLSKSYAAGISVDDNCVDFLLRRQFCDSSFLVPSIYGSPAVSACKNEPIPGPAPLNHFGFEDECLFHVSANFSQDTEARTCDPVAIGIPTSESSSSCFSELQPRKGAQSYISMKHTPNLFDHVFDTLVLDQRSPLRSHRPQHWLGSTEFNKTLCASSEYSKRVSFLACSVSTCETYRTITAESTSTNGMNLPQASKGPVDRIPYFTKVARMADFPVEFGVVPVDETEGYARTELFESAQAPKKRSTGGKTPRLGFGGSTEGTYRASAGMNAARLDVFPHGKLAPRAVHAELTNAAHAQLDDYESYASGGGVNGSYKAYAEHPDKEHRECAECDECDRRTDYGSWSSGYSVVSDSQGRRFKSSRLAKTLPGMGQVGAEFSGHDSGKTQKSTRTMVVTILYKPESVVSGARVTFTSGSSEPQNRPSAPGKKPKDGVPRKVGRPRKNGPGAKKPRSVVKKSPKKSANPQSRMHKLGVSQYPYKVAEAPSNWQAGPGCWTCRIRHKSCPQDSEICSSCRRLSLYCDRSKTRPHYMLNKDASVKVRREIREVTDLIRHRCDRVHVKLNGEN